VLQANAGVNARLTPGPQRHARYLTAVNDDGKMNPALLHEMEGANYL